MQLTLTYKTKHQQSQKHLLNLKLLLILLNPLIFPNQMRLISMGHQLRFQGLIPWQPVHRLHLQKVLIFLNQIPAMPLFRRRCSGYFIQTSLQVTYHSIVLLYMADKAFRAWALTESGWHTMENTRLCIAPFVWCMLPRRVETCRWSRAVLTGGISQQDCLNMKRSHCHKHFTDAYFLNACKRSIKHILLKERLSLRTQQVLQRRSVSKCVIDVLFYIGFQGLPYRSKHRKAVATIFDESNHDNRRNFLQAIKLLAEYNPHLQEHL